MLCMRGTSHGPVSLSVCLSVCLSQIGVLLKRLNIGSQKQNHTIAQGFLFFLVPKISAKFDRGHPLRRRQGHVSNFYTVDLEIFATASRRYTGDIHNSSVVGLFMTPIGQCKRLVRIMVECTCLLRIDPL